MEVGEVVYGGNLLTAFATL